MQRVGRPLCHEPRNASTHEPCHDGQVALGAQAQGGLGPGLQRLKDQETWAVDTNIYKVCLLRWRYGEGIEATSMAV